MKDYKFSKFGESELPLFSFDLRELLAREQVKVPALPPLQLEIWIQNQPTLACIQSDSTKAAIRLHSVLNHADTPESVIAFILCHELLHLVIPPEKLNGRLITHPPSFREGEIRLSPNRTLAWGWLFLELGQCMKVDAKRECTFVKSNWKHLMNERRSTMEEAALVPGVKDLQVEIGEPML